MKTLAVDYGKSKVGVAVSDEMGIVSQALPVIFAKKVSEKLQKLEDCIYNNAPQEIIVGVAGLDLGGKKLSDQALENIEFAKELKSFLGLKSYEIPVKLWDESYSSQNAEKGKSKKFKKNKSDSEAARLFLQEYLDSPDKNSSIKI